MKNENRHIYINIQIFSLIAHFYLLRIALNQDVLSEIHFTSQRDKIHITKQNLISLLTFSSLFVPSTLLIFLLIIIHSQTVILTSSWAIFLDICFPHVNSIRWFSAHQQCNWHISCYLICMCAITSSMITVN